MGTSLRWLSFWLVLAGQLFAPAFSDRGVTITTNSAEVIYPQYIQFKLEANNETGIQSAMLIYGIDRLTCQPTSSRQAIDFQPGNEVSLEWNLEFSRSGVIPPSAEVWWQWEITDWSGITSRTEKKSITVQDGRFEWQKLTRSGITVQWYQGSTHFGQVILLNAEKNLKRLSSNMDIQPSKQIWIIVYASNEEMRMALGSLDDWAGAVALPDYGIILLGLAPTELDYADYYLSHELTHLVVGELTFNCTGVELPTWLNEGLAEISQGKPSQEELDAVTLAIESQTLPALDDIANGFSAYGDQARMEYTQSELAVEYLLDTYGPDKMSALLAAFQSGLFTDEALQKVYGMDTAGIDLAWKKSLGFNVGSYNLEIKPTSTLVPTLALWTVAVYPSDTPTTTPEPTATRTTPLTARPVLPTPTAGTLVTSTEDKPSDPSPVQFCLGILMIPAYLSLFLIRKKESVK